MAGDGRSTERGRVRAGGRSVEFGLRCAVEQLWADYGVGELRGTIRAGAVVCGLERGGLRTLMSLGRVLREGRRRNRWP